MTHTHNEKPHALNFRNGPHKIRFKLFQLVDNGDGDPKIKAMRHILLGAANQFSFGPPLAGGEEAPTRPLLTTKLTVTSVIIINSCGTCARGVSFVIHKSKLNAYLHVLT